MLEAPSPKNPGLAGGGVWTRDDELDGFRDDAIGADIDGLRLTKLNGRPSSESLSPVEPPEDKSCKNVKLENYVSFHHDTARSVENFEGGQNLSKLSSSYIYKAVVLTWNKCKVKVNHSLTLWITLTIILLITL